MHRCIYKNLQSFIILIVCTVNYQIMLRIGVVYILYSPDHNFQETITVYKKTRTPESSFKGTTCVYDRLEHPILILKKKLLVYETSNKQLAPSKTVKLLIDLILRKLVLQHFKINYKATYIKL